MTQEKRGRLGLAFAVWRFCFLYGLLGCFIKQRALWQMILSGFGAKNSRKDLIKLDFFAIYGIFGSNKKASAIPPGVNEKKGG